MTQEALKLALEALEKALRYHSVMLLSDPPQDAWKYHCVEQTAHEAITAIKEALAQTQEPVVKLKTSNMLLRCHRCGCSDKLNIHIEYTLPPQRTWVDLTDEEIKGVRHSFPTGSVDDLHSFARAILNKSKEKNNG